MSYCASESDSTRGPNGCQQFSEISENIFPESFLSAGRKISQVNRKWLNLRVLSLALGRPTGLHIGTLAMLPFADSLDTAADGNYNQLPYMRRARSLPAHDSAVRMSRPTKHRIHATYGNSLRGRVWKGTGRPC